VIEAGPADLEALLAAGRAALRAPDRLYLVAATSHLAEGWRARVPRLELAGPADVEAPVRAAADARGVPLVWESPADVIPLPDGWESRCPPLTPRTSHPAPVFHFDPYSVVLRLIARGDEPDYLVALEYMRHGWVDFARLEALHAEVLPRFTSASLAQDPAEFRRKFRGLRQLHLTATRSVHILAPLS
jgi:hypothetical protein